MRLNLLERKVLDRAILVVVLGRFDSEVWMIFDGPLLLRSIRHFSVHETIVSSGTIALLRRCPIKRALGAGPVLCLVVCEGDGGLMRRAEAGSRSWLNGARMFG